MRTLLALVVLLLAGCESTKVLPNGCVIDALSYRYSLQAHHDLQGWGDARILIVRYTGVSVQHAYCVWSQPPYIYAYDAFDGSRAVNTRFYGPNAIAQALDGDRVATAVFLPE